MAFKKILNTKEARWISQEKYGGNRPFLFWIDLLRCRLGYPLAYIIGNIPFLSATIDLSYKPFIPREETAFWVEIALEKIQKESGGQKPLHILDIFAGSGAIGIAVAKALPDARVFFVEKNARFTKQIQKNISLNNIAKRAHILPYTNSSYVKQSFDYVFANPPYISTKGIKNIQPSVLLWEPLQALFSRNNGMKHIEQLITYLPTILNNKGTLFLEHDPWQAEPVRILCEKNGIQTQIHADQYQNVRMTSIYRPL